jgi:hypothetical protein
VTSKVPSVHSLICRAWRSTSRTSAWTGTGCTPAAALIRSTSLPGRHVLISASSRSNSANTASNAERAAASSVVHARRLKLGAHGDAARST